LSKSFLGNDVIPCNVSESLNFVFSLRFSKEVLLMKANIKTASCKLFQLRPDVILG